MSNDVRDPIQRFKELVLKLTRPITVSPEHKTQIPKPDNDDATISDSLVAIINSNCGNCGIINCGNITTYYIVSKNKITFCEFECQFIIVIQTKREDNKEMNRIKFAMLNAERVVLCCDGDDSTPIQPYGYNPLFFTDLKKCTVTRYIKTEQTGVLIRRTETYDELTKLSYDIQDDGFEVKLKDSKSNPQTDTPQ